MANITLSIPDDLLKEGREYAKKKNTSLNALIRSLLKMTIVNKKKGWLEEVYKIADQSPSSSKGKAWKREDLYAIAFGAKI
jgi:hypothetical protein